MASKAQIAQAAKQQIAQSTAAELQDGLYKAYRAAIEDALAMSKELTPAVKEAASEGSYRRDMFERLGALAQQSMVEAYREMVEEQEGPASKTHYRAGEGRLAGGALREALADESFFYGTADGLVWGDLKSLDFLAAHWHRLNFGAGARGQGVDVEYPVAFGPGSALSLSQGPSPGFSMPSGFWISQGGNAVRPNAGRRGQDMFYNSAATQRAKGRVGPRGTQGIKGRDFIGAGLKRLADEIPAAYQAYTEDVIEGAIKKVAAKRKRKVVRSSRPNLVRQGRTEFGLGSLLKIRGA